MIHNNGIFIYKVPKSYDFFLLATAQMIYPIIPIPATRITQSKLGDKTNPAAWACAVSFSEESAGKGLSSGVTVAVVGLVCCTDEVGEGVGVFCC